MAASKVADSIIGAGCQVAATVKHSVLFEKVRVGRHSQITHSLVLPGATVGRDCQIEGAIVEGGCQVPDGTVIGGLFCERGDAKSLVDGIRLVTAESLITPNEITSKRLQVA